MRDMSDVHLREQWQVRGIRWAQEGFEVVGDDGREEAVRRKPRP